MSDQPADERADAAPDQTDGRQDENAGRLAALNRYLSEEIHTVDGWCLPQPFQALWPLANLMGDGPVSEIGVYEGKFVIGLAKMFGAASGQAVTAYDIFDMQHLNIDQAGAGKRDVFERNYQRLGLPMDSLHCHEVDSLTLGGYEAHQHIERYGRPALFSIDGCHEVTHTMRDIEFAMAVTAPSGVIVVDDYTNPDWPGVQEAVAKMYLMRNFAFVPLTLICNKLLLCAYSHHAAYLQAVETYVRAHHPGAAVKRVKRFGYDTLTIRPRLDVFEPLQPV